MHTPFDDEDYQPDKRLVFAVMSKNVKLVRVLLSAELSDAKFNHHDLLNTLAYVTEHFPETFEPFTTERSVDAMREDPNTWDRAYFMRQQIQLQNNFAFDRFEHLIEVRSVIQVPSSTAQKPADERGVGQGAQHAEITTLTDDTTATDKQAEEQTAQASEPVEPENHTEINSHEAEKSRGKAILWIILLILFGIGAWFTLSK